MNKIYIFYTFDIKHHPLKWERKYFYYDKFFHNKLYSLKNFWFTINWDRFYFNHDNLYF